MRLALTLTGLFASAALAAAPLDVVRECAAAASPGVSGLENLEAACPQLDAALTALGLNEILYDGWQQKVTVHALQDAAALAERYAESKPRRSLDPGVLRGILGSYKTQPEPPHSWWRALEDWFKRWLAHSNSSLANWLNRLWDRWLSPEVSPGFLKVFMYGLTALAVSAAIVVIIRELKAAGMTRRLGGAARARGARGGSHDPAAGVEAAPAMSSVAELLHALVQRLLQSGRLKAERSLTHRELIVRSTFDDEAQRIVFAGVARTAESLLYGSQGAAPEVLEQVTRQGRALLLQLSNSTSRP
ncbi:MAG TPA: hypothetical protein VNH39_09165 [Steroidobacteraceae bacterium]|nr:hypothetical protein [Steroidobacteraceae bacterium]